MNIPEIRFSPANQGTDNDFDSTITQNRGLSPIVRWLVEAPSKEDVVK